MEQTKIRDYCREIIKYVRGKERLLDCHLWECDWLLRYHYVTECVIGRVIGCVIGVCQVLR